MSIFGTYYAVAPQAADSPLASIHFGVTILTVLVLTPGIAMAITGRGEILAQAGPLLALLSMALFALNVFGYGTWRVSQNQGSGKVTKHQLVE